MSPGALIEHMKDFCSIEDSTEDSEYKEYLEAEIALALKQCDIEYSAGGKTALGVVFDAGSLKGLQLLVNEVPMLMSPNKEGDPTETRSS